MGKYLDMLLEFYKQSSMLYWWPKVKEVKVPKPKTYIIKLKGDEISKTLNWIRRGKLPSKYRNQLKKYGAKLGYPLFLRTDEFSNKWDFENSCYVASIDQLEEHALALIEASLFHDLVVRAFILREYIELDWKFKAFWGKLPIAPERRYIIRDGMVVEHFPYWPEDAIRKPDRKDWLKLLREMNKETKEEVRLLTEYAEEIGRYVKGNWSVDFVKTKNGKWYFIDMAREEVSWKPSMKPRERASSNLFDFMKKLKEVEK